MKSRKKLLNSLLASILISALSFVLITGACIYALYSIVMRTNALSPMQCMGVVFVSICLGSYVLYFLNKFSDEFILKLHQKEIKILYHNEDMEKLCYVAGKSDWIDLRSSETVEIKKGEHKIIDLGVSVKLPEGYEMIIAPRSSMFKNYGLLQTNSIGVIDESYSSDEDILKLSVYATRDTVVNKNDRLCQFRIIEHQPQIIFSEVKSLGHNERGGLGSTGRN